MWNVYFICFGVVRIDVIDVVFFDFGGVFVYFCGIDVLIFWVVDGDCEWFWWYWFILLMVCVFEIGCFEVVFFVRWFGEEFVLLFEFNEIFCDLCDWVFYLFDGVEVLFEDFDGWWIVFLSNINLVYWFFYVECMVFYFEWFFFLYEIGLFKFDVESFLYVVDVMDCFFLRIFFFDDSVMNVEGVWVVGFEVEVV